MRNTLIACCILLLASLGAHAQCTIQASYTKVCLGNTVSFSRTPATANDSAFLWNFGDGSTSQQAGTTYQYNQSGTFTVTLRIYRKGGTFCDATPLQLTVFPKPIAAYQLIGNDTQCFNHNSFVFSDLSGPGASNAPIRRRTMLYGDGAFVQQTPPYHATLNHSYTDAAGGAYVTVLEVEDTNGCLNQVVDTFYVFPKLTASFSLAQNMQCGKTLVTFYNQSEGDTTGLSNLWLYGNGQTGTQYTNFEYLYVGDTSYYPKLIVTNAKGCKDTSLSTTSVYAFSADSNIIILPSNRQCFSTNEFTITNNTKVPYSGAFYWVVLSDDVTYQRDSIKPSLQYVTFPNCGLYSIKLFFSYANCSFETDTQIYVYGPKVSLTNSSPQPLNWIQCGTHDTVNMRVNDISCYFQNSNLKYFWDFDDSYAPSCTTDTKNNINTTLNCRYSVDSIMVKHLYSFPSKNCYMVKMHTYDPVLNCGDTIIATLRLAYPKVGWDSTTTPPSPRAVGIPKYCDINPGVITWGMVEPYCGAEAIYLLPDTSCGPNWKLVDTLGSVDKYEVSIGDICSTDSNVVFGIIAKNGLDPLGNACYDTAYYKYKVSIPLPNLNFRITRHDSDMCAPYGVRVYLPDSITKIISKVEYDFGDGTPIQTLYLNQGDTIIRSVFHAFLRAGYYEQTITYYGRSGCFGYDETSFKVGNQASFQILTPNVCTEVPASFEARVRYESDTSLEYWSNPYRSQRGLESVFWDFNDGSAWVQSLEKVTHKYTLSGTYNIKMAYRDSLGCFDTVQGGNLNIIVSSVKAKIASSADTFYCAPSIVTFTDSSYVFYGNNTPNPSLITRRVWNFDAGKGSSTLYQPGIFYGENGTYQANLYSESVYGCWDTTTKQVVILGPTPRFVITNDTFGCVPYTVKLKNTTGKQLRNWIWYFNDPANTIFSTGQDSDVTFTYTAPGVYRIDLLGEDRVYNPTTGSFKTCSQTFPYLDNPNAFHPRQVTVLPYDTLHIVTEDTVCVGVPFLANVERGRVVNEVKWNWGDISPIKQASINVAVQHTYDSSGKYLIKVNPVIVAPNQCVIPDEKAIYAQQPEAAFEVNIKDYPEIRFINQSTQASRFWWNFGDALSGSNTSTEVNPKHVFTTGDTLYKVCLSAFDARDCMDSVCKYISLKARVIIPNVFTPGNGDEKNDAFDIDIEGYELYELFIYNRWGTMVYESSKDGYRNDGINWNGKDKNSGDDCAEGVYYVVFKYKLITEKENQVYHGTVTLIRN